MEAMVDLHVRVFERVIDLIYGDYDPDTVTPEAQLTNNQQLKERLVRWKDDFVYRKIIGPLQPSFLFSRMAKVPVDMVDRIALELDMKLPDEIDLSEVTLPELPYEEVEALWSSLEDADGDMALDILSQIEKPPVPFPFDFVDLTRTGTPVTNEINAYSPYMLNAISYLENVIDKIKAGEVHAMTVVALLNNGKATLWIPQSVQEGEVSEVYDPIIEALKATGPMSESN